MFPAAKTKKIRLSRPSSSYSRVTFDHPPLNLVAPELVLEFREIMTASRPTSRFKSWFSTAQSTGSS